MVCRLCLIDSDESIDIFSEANILEYIVKFLQLELSPEDPASRVICTICWQELDSFQNFVLRVEEAQKSLPALHQELKMNVSETVTERTPVVEYEGVESDECISDSEAFPLFEVVEVKKEEITDQTLHQGTIETIDLLPTYRTTIEIDDNTPSTRNIRPKRSCLRKIWLEAHEQDEADCTKTKRKRGRKPNIEQAPTKKAKNQLEIENNIGIEDIKPQCSRSKKIKVETSTTDKGSKIKVKKKSDLQAKEKPVTEKVPSERTQKLLATSKKFDDIIKEHMTLYCDICKVELTDFAQLKLHFRRVHNLKGYAVCCNKRMHKRHLVVDHITSHDGVSYTCIVCGKNASSRDALRSHLKYVHLTKREFQCTFCDKAFKKALDLKEHTATHTGEVLYMCPHCTKTFTSRATLHGHRKEKHRAEWEANKRCSYF